MHLIPSVIAVLGIFTGLALCAAVPRPQKKLVVAECKMEPNRKPPQGVKSTVEGNITIYQSAAGGKPHFKVDLKNVGAPFSLHGFHIHEGGDIISEGCQSTGGHYNPNGYNHAGPRGRKRHVGDLGNLETDCDGNIKTQFDDTQVSLVGSMSVIGRSFVIHAMADDLGCGYGAARAESLRTGNAGARLGCCVIRKVPRRTWRKWGR